jgi:subtilisin family serine protease
MVDEASRSKDPRRQVFPRGLAWAASGDRVISDEVVADGICLAVADELIVERAVVGELRQRLEAERLPAIAEQVHDDATSGLGDLGLEIVRYARADDDQRTVFEVVEAVAPIGDALRRSVGVHHLAGFTPNHQGVDDPVALRSRLGERLLGLQREAVADRLEGIASGRGTPVGVALVDSGDLQQAPKAGGGAPDKVIVIADKDDIDEIPADEPIAQPAGHGAMVGSVVAATILDVPDKSVRAVYEALGSPMTEEVIAVQLAQALAHAPVDIVNFSLSVYGYLDEPPLLLRAALRAFLTDAGDRQAAEGRLVVAAAGNHGTTRPSYPAAYWDRAGGAPFDRVVSVGALAGALVETPTRVRAGYSNSGRSVRVYAPGTVTGRYVTGELELPGGFHRDFEGYATWSGTSFAAPYVVGVIAAAMGDDDETSTALGAWAKVEGLNVNSRQAIGLIKPDELHR